MILDIAEEVISGYIWECNIRNYTQADHWKDKKSLYITQFDLGYPEKQYPWDANDCHDKGLFKNVNRDPRTKTDQGSNSVQDSKLLKRTNCGYGGPGISGLEL